MVQCNDLLAALADSVLEAWMCLSLQQALLQNICRQRFRFLDFEIAEELLSVCVFTPLSFLKD